ncbi:MAG TPA: ABC transporter permease [Pyrinomonadaceae bacterium]|nr:ABC transporter permease [Pyrinomonadaceae bacterium]
MSEIGNDVMETLRKDITYGVRMLFKSPGFTVVAVLALTLGFGANTAIFSVVNSVLLRPLPYSEPGRLMQLWETDARKGRNEMPASYPNFADWRNQKHAFEEVVAYSDWTFNLTGDRDPERIRSAIVSPAFFSTLGIKPILGRAFLSGEDERGKDLVAVIGESLWRRRFDSDPNIVGRSLNLDDKSFTVVGVIARGVQAPLLSDEIELWAPISHGFGFTERNAHYLNVVARLKPEATLQQAQADMNTIAGRLEQQYPESNKGRGIRAVSLSEQIVGNFRTSLLVMLGAVVFVLLIGSANVANMSLARAAARQKEMAIRTALGAGRLQIVRQLLTESVLLSLFSGTLGLLVAIWGIDLLVALSPADLPRVKEVTIDLRVLGFTLAVSILTGILFGLLPALQASRPNLNERLKAGARNATSGSSRQRLRGFLVITEIALSLVLLVGAGLLIRSFLRLQAVDPGFNPTNVLTMQIDLTGPKYKTGSQVIAFQNQLLERVKQLPGVQSAGTRSFVPIASDASFAYLRFTVEGRQGDVSEAPVAYYNGVSSDYFQTMMIPLLKGRGFSERDVRGSQNVAIANATLAKRYFGAEDPLGKRISLEDNPKEADWITIVGVVGDTKPRELRSEPVAEMYMPYNQQPERGMSLMIRYQDGGTSVAAAVRNEVMALDKDQPVYSIRTLDSVLSESVAAPRFRTLVLAVFAGVALILASVGIYGVISYGVSQRTQEIGIRMALGARTPDVLKLVVKGGIMLVLIGVAIGLAGAFALTRLLTTLLFAVTPTDAATFATVSVGLIVVALIASYIPARRATKVDPLVALRYE